MKRTIKQKESCQDAVPHIGIQIIRYSVVNTINVTVSWLPLVATSSSPVGSAMTKSVTTLWIGMDSPLQWLAISLHVR
jgi:hypothetical protein